MNGVSGGVTLASLYATSPYPEHRKPELMVWWAPSAARFPANPTGIVAEAQLSGSNIYINQGAINPSNYCQNLGVVDT